MYETDVKINSFRGLMQYGDGVDGDLRYAVDAEGMDTSGGTLKPMEAHTLIVPATPAKIETLAVLHRRWYVGAESTDVLVAAAGGVLYWMYEGGSAWTALSHAAFTSNVWSVVQYEIEPTPPATDPIDVLVMSNGVDGMVYVRVDDSVKSVTDVTTPEKFNVITRYNERIFGADIADNPDMVCYSAPYDFTDWAVDAIPEDGGGDIQQPTWDGDSFTALYQLGSQLIAFRRNTVWRVLGTDPGEWTWKQQYGGGTAYQNTIAVDGERILMLGDKGLLQYDGLAVAPYKQEPLKDFWATLNVSALEQACACVHDHKYYLSVPTGTSLTNDKVVIYDTVEDTWMLRDGDIEAFCPSDSLYFTSVAGRIYTWGGGNAIPCDWTSPWITLGKKDVLKGGWTVYLDGSTGSISVSIETEKKKKTKTCSFGSKQKRLQFGGNGRKFRLVIESTGTVSWEIVGGIQITTELDPD